MAARTMFEKIWDAHVVHEEPGQPSLIYIDLHLVHEVTFAASFRRSPHGRPQGAPARPHRRHRRPQHPPPGNSPDPIEDQISKAQLDALDRNAAEFGLPFYYDRFSENQGIVHVIGPDLGYTLPGKTVVCGDSHTSTHGALGCFAVGIGTSEVEPRPRHPDPAPVQAPHHGGARGRAVAQTACLPRTSSSAHHRPHRRQRRHRPRHRVHRRGHPRPVHGRAHDRLQHEHRGWRPRRHDRPRRNHLRVRPYPALRSQGRRAGSVDRTVAPVAHRRRRRLRPHRRHQRRRPGSFRHLGHQARHGRSHHRPGAGPELFRDHRRARGRRTRPGVHGPGTQPAHRGHQD